MIQAEQQKLRTFLSQYLPASVVVTDDLINCFTLLHLQKDGLFHENNKVSTHIGFVLSGILRSYYVNVHGEDITHNFYTGNTLVTSYKSFTEREPSYLGIVAVEPCSLLVVSADKLFDPLHSIIAQALMARFSHLECLRLEELNNILFHATAEGKCEWFMKNYPEVAARVPQKYCATFLGTVRETICRKRTVISRRK